MHPLLPVAAGTVILGSVLLAPTLVVGIAERRSPEVVFTVPTPEKVVALTIDDGPSPATPELLGVLEDHGVRATFFLLGRNVDAHPEIMRSLVTAGHEIGHHMMEDRPSRALSPDEFAARFDRMDAILEGAGGSTVFRPGSGWYDDEMVEVAATRGYRTVLGSVYPFDAHLPWPWLHAMYVRWHAGPGDILILHDGADRGRTTAEALRSILPELQARGYQVVPVSELLRRGEQASSGLTKK